MTRIHTFLPIAPLALVLAGCVDEPAATDPAPELLPASACAPECYPDDQPIPPGADPETTCYDGCNWCTCTTEGPMNCTARACFDAGVRSDDQRSLPAAACEPACWAGGPPPPPGMEGESTCYDGCNWCRCTTDGPVQCTARLCDAGAGG